MVRPSAAAADRIEPAPFKRPAKLKPLDTGLEKLLAIWRRHRPGTAPSQGLTKGRFGALAQELFAGPPCSFGASNVKHAVERLLPATTAPRPASEPPARGDGAPPPAEVLVVGAGTKLGDELVEQYRAEGAAVAATPWDGATHRAVVGRSTADLVVIVPSCEQLLAPRRPRRPPSLDLAGMMEGLVTAPERVLTALEERPAGAPCTVALVIPALPDAPQHLVAAWRSLYLARAAQVMLIRFAERMERWSGATLVAVQPGWGSDRLNEGLPVVASTAEHTARTLRATLAVLGPERSGGAFDLQGSPLAVLQAWPSVTDDLERTEQAALRLWRRLALGDPGVDEGCAE